MDRQTSLGSRSQGSFGHIGRPARDLPRSRDAKTVPVRSVVAGLLAAVAPVVAFAPSVFAGDRFLFVRTVYVFGSSETRYQWVPAFWTGSPLVSWSLLDLATSDAGWAALALSLVLAPFWFLAWRLGRAPAGRAIGLMWSASAAVAALILPSQQAEGMLRAVGKTPSNSVGGSHWTLLAASALLVAAFAVAPAPVAREAEEA